MEGQIAEVRTIPNLSFTTYREFRRPTARDFAVPCHSIGRQE